MKTGSALTIGILAGLSLTLSACAPQGPITTAYDGVYEGQASLTSPAMPCEVPGNLSPMKVSGGHVDFGNLRGWVQQDGQVNLVFGRVYVVGQFQGTHFSGQIMNPQPACNYNLSMDRVGS